MSERFVLGFGGVVETYPPDAPVTRASLPLISLLMGWDMVVDLGDMVLLMLFNLSLALLIIGCWSDL